jgi:hypothetical protein
MKRGHAAVTAVTALIFHMVGLFMVHSATSKIVRPFTRGIG